jgi:hypothetical protein
MGTTIDADAQSLFKLCAVFAILSLLFSLCTPAVGACDPQTQTQVFPYSSLSLSTYSPAKPPHASSKPAQT